MSVISYFIHDLVEVQVAPGVKKEAVKFLDFQLGGFKNRPGDGSDYYKIIIKPYDDFRFDPHASVSNLWWASGVTGRSFDNPVEQFALNKGVNSFTIYTNGRRFPINMFIQFALISRGISLLPAAGLVGGNNQATLLTGAGYAGKTTITLSAVRSGKCRLLGDDTICIGESGYALSYPREFTIKEYHCTTFPEYFETQPSLNKKKFIAFAKQIVRQISQNMPFLGLMNALLIKLDQPAMQKKLIPDFSPGKAKKVLSTVPLENIYGRNKLVPQANIGKVLYLERYNGDTIKTAPIDADKLAARMCAFLCNEWASSARMLYLISALELVDLQELFNRSREVIYSGIKNKECERLLIPKSCAPEILSKYYLSNHVDGT